MAPSKEPMIQTGSPLPKGYRIVPKGHAYITRLCRSTTLAAHQKVYTVLDKKTPIGIAIPKYIHSRVLSVAASTRENRMANSRQREACQLAAAGSALQQLYPRFPRERAEKVVKHAFKKRSGRVGRAGNLSTEEKVTLAVQAHARHAFTNYDNLLRGTKRDDEVKHEARRKVWPRVEG